jgi:hypothetical protein
MPITLIKDFSGICYIFLDKQMGNLIISKNRGMG